MSRDVITTREIATIAVLASLGGTLSTFVGYLGNIINLSLGIPFGAGQFLAGLHVFWIVLIRTLVPRNTAGTFGGLVKGLMELFTGGTHGIVIVLVSLIQGMIIDIVAKFGGSPENAGVKSRIVWWIGAGIAAASNVIVFQVFYFAGVPTLYIAIISLLAFCSGAIFAGYFAWETLEFLNDAGILSYQLSSARMDPSPVTKKGLVRRNIPAIAIIFFLVIGSSIYVSTVAQLNADPHVCEVEGLVETPFSFHTSMFAEQEVTIEAELVGATTHLPRANYTGILVRTILEHAVVLPDASWLTVIARDGYAVRFPLDDVMIDSQFILSETDEGLWLIADQYDGSLWVRQVSTLYVS